MFTKSHACISILCTVDPLFHSHLRCPKILHDYNSWSQLMTEAVYKRVHSSTKNKLFATVTEKFLMYPFVFFVPMYSWYFKDIGTCKQKALRHKRKNK